MNNQPYTSDDDTDFHICQQCGELFLKWHDENNQYCPYCVLTNHWEYDTKIKHWHQNLYVWDDY